MNRLETLQRQLRTEVDPSQRKALLRAIKAESNRDVAQRQGREKMLGLQRHNEEVRDYNARLLAELSRGLREILESRR